jgi:hypothetical protein
VKTKVDYRPILWLSFLPIPSLRRSSLEIYKCLTSVSAITTQSRFFLILFLCFIFLTRSFQYRELNLISGFYFPFHRRRGTKVNIPTLIPTADSRYNRLPIVESIIGGAHTIHDTFVTVRFMGMTHRFLFSYTFNLDLPRNRGLASVVPGVEWNGELIIMRSGDRTGVINMRGPKAAMLKATRA